MPTYSYACDACGGSFELEQRIVEDPIKKCALCGKPEARRQIVSANFILKGGGWYSDGYGSSKSKSAPESDSKSESKAKETKTETKADSKAETKSDSKSESSSSSSTTEKPAKAKSEPKASAAE